MFLFLEDLAVSLQGSKSAEEGNVTLCPWLTLVTSIQWLRQTPCPEAFQRAGDQVSTVFEASVELTKVVLVFKNAARAKSSRDMIRNGANMICESKLYNNSSLYDLNLQTRERLFFLVPDDQGASLAQRSGFG